MKLKRFIDSLKDFVNSSAIQIPSLSRQRRINIKRIDQSIDRPIQYCEKKNIKLLSKKESLRDANFPWKTVIAFYPNRVTATRFQRTSRRKSPWLLNETGIRRGGKLPRGLQREPHSSWGRGIPRMAARATRQTREKIFRRSIEPLPRTDTGNEARQ